MIEFRDIMIKIQDLPDQPDQCLIGLNSGFNPFYDNEEQNGK